MSSTQDREGAQPSRLRPFFVSDPEPPILGSSLRMTAYDALNRNSVRDRKVSPGLNTVVGKDGRFGLF